MSRRPGSDRLAGAARSMAASTVVAVLATAVSWFLFGRRQLADVVMVYLLGIILVSLRFGYGLAQAPECGPHTFTGCECGIEQQSLSAGFSQSLL